MRTLALVAVFLAASGPSIADDDEHHDNDDQRMERHEHDWRPPEGRYDRDGHYRVECREFDFYGVCVDN